MSVICSREFWLIGRATSINAGVSLRPATSSAESLRPELQRGIHLRPGLSHVLVPDEAGDDTVPEVTAATELKPEPFARDLVPKIGSVTEE